LIGYIKSLNKWFLLSEGVIQDSSDMNLTGCGKCQEFITSAVDKIYHVDTIEKHISVNDFIVGVEEENNNKNPISLFRDKYKPTLYINGVGKINVIVAYTNDEWQGDMVNKLIGKNFHTLIEPMESLYSPFGMMKHNKAPSYEDMVEKYGIRVFKPDSHRISKQSECELGDIYVVRLWDDVITYVLQFKNEYATLLDCKAVEYTTQDELRNQIDSFGANVIPNSLCAYDFTNVIKKASRRVSVTLTKMDITEFVKSQEEFNIYFSDSMNVGNCENGTIAFGLTLLNSPNLTVNRYTDLPLDDATAIIKMCRDSIVYCNKDEVLAGLEMDNMAFKTTVANKMLQIKNKGEDKYE
jgi:hypothetical protein